MKKLADISAFESLGASKTAADISVFNGECTDYIVSMVRRYDDEWGFKDHNGIARFIGVEVGKEYYDPFADERPSQRTEKETNQIIDKECEDILNVLVDDMRYVDWGTYGDILEIAKGIAKRCAKDRSAWDGYSW